MTEKHNPNVKIKELSLHIRKNKLWSH